MALCPHCESDVGDPDYVRKTVEPKAGGGRAVTMSTTRPYWMVVCPDCEAVLGTIAA